MEERSSGRVGAEGIRPRQRRTWMHRARRVWRVAAPFLLLVAGAILSMGVVHVIERPARFQPEEKSSAAPLRGPALPGQVDLSDDTLFWDATRSMRDEVMGGEEILLPAHDGVHEGAHVDLDGDPSAEDLARSFD